MKFKILLLSIPFLICACSETGEVDKPVDVETPDTKVEDGTETDLDTLPDLIDTLKS